MTTVNVWLFGRPGKWWKLKSTLPYYSKSRWRVFTIYFRKFPGFDGTVGSCLVAFVKPHQTAPFQPSLHCPLQAPTWFLSIVMLNWLIAGGTWQSKKKQKKIQPLVPFKPTLEVWVVCPFEKKIHKISNFNLAPFWHLQAHQHDALLSLKANVLGPFNKARQVPWGLNITSKTIVPGSLLEQRIP